MSDNIRRSCAVLAAAAVLLASPGLPAYAAAGKSAAGKSPARVSFAAVSAASRQIPSVPGEMPLIGRAPGAVKSDPSVPSAATAADALPDDGRHDSLPPRPKDASVADVAAGRAVSASGAIAAEALPLTEAQLAAAASETFFERPALGDHFVALANHFRAKPLEQVPDTAPAAPARMLGLDLSGHGAVNIGLKPSAGRAFTPQMSSEESPAHAPVAPVPPYESKPHATVSEAVSPAKPADGLKSLLGGFFNVGRTALLFITALVILQVGIESQGAALPALMEEKFGDFTMATELTVTSMFAGFFGRMAAPKIIDTFGLKKTFIGTLAARAILMGTLAALLYFNMMTVPALFLLFAANGFISGISITAEMSIPPALVGQNPDKLENFWAIEQTALEVVAIVGTIATGALIASVGYVPLMAVFPIALIAAIAMLIVTLRLPPKLKAMAQADAQGATAGPSAAERKKRSIGNGAKVVWGNPVLKYSFLAYTAFMMLNPFLYGILAAAYGILAAGGVAALGANAYTMITGLYSLGGLVAGALIIWESKKIKKLMHPAPGSGLVALKQESVDEQLRRSMLKWMKWSTFGLALIASFAIPAPMLSALVTLPAGLGWLGALTLPALALVPFGIAQVAASLKLRSFFQAKAPAADMADTMGFLGAVSLAISTVGLLLLKFMFKGVSLFGLKLFPAFTGLSGYTPFIVLAVLMVPLALVYWRLTRKLDAVSAPAIK